LKDSGVLIVQPQAALSADDFRAMAHVDPFIEGTGS
jgi:hypothetical protein